MSVGGCFSPEVSRRTPACSSSTSRPIISTSGINSNCSIWSGRWTGRVIMALHDLDLAGGSVRSGARARGWSGQGVRTSIRRTHHLGGGNCLRRRDFRAREPRDRPFTPRIRITKFSTTTIIFGECTLIHVKTRASFGAVVAATALLAVSGCSATAPVDEAADKTSVTLGETAERKALSSFRSRTSLRQAMRPISAPFSESAVWIVSLPSC